LRKKKTTSNWLNRIDLLAAVAFAVLASVLAAIFTVLLLVFLQFNIHESGHIVGCFVSGWLEDKQVQCGYTAWAKIPVINGILEIPVPQQTGSSLQPSFLFAFMGPGWTVFAFAAIVLLARHHWKIDWRICLVVFVLIAFQETLLNAACGTDNLAGKPYQFCEGNALVKFIGEWLYALMVLPIAYSFYPGIHRWYADVLAKRRAYVKKVMKR